MRKHLTYLFVLAAISAQAQFDYNWANPIEQFSLFPTAQDITDSVDVDLFHSEIRPYRLKHSRMGMQTLDQHWNENRWEWAKSNLWYRHIFNEHALEFENKDVHLVIDPYFDYQYGQSNQTEYTLWTNTRGAHVEGRIGSQFTFESTLTENQAFMPAYLTEYIRNQQVVPGQGMVREFKTHGFDYAWSSGNLSYTPSKYFNFTVGQGKHFFGDGYRSLLLSDNTFNYPYVKIETSFWRIKYVNLWAQMYDLRPEVNLSGQFRRKYYSSHLLSYNVTPRLNLYAFEAIVFRSDTTNGGFDPVFYNPVIFYRPIEFAVDSRSGNALLGGGGSYKFIMKDDLRLQLYFQGILDEFNLAAMKAQSGSWLNKFGIQVGLNSHWRQGATTHFARVELNSVRPFTYSHRDPLTNYGHYAQPLAHPWGANFMEFVFQYQVQHKRLGASIQMNIGVRGMDTNDVTYGNDIYKPYLNREILPDGSVRDLGYTIGQEALSMNYFYADLKVWYVLNPKFRWRFEAGYSLRNTSSKLNSNMENWYYMGMKTSLFNSYYDL